MRVRYRIIFFTLAGAFTCAFLGVAEYRLAQRSSKEPEEVSLQRLIERGAAGNPNIVLTDFSLSDERICDKRLSGEWKSVWVPVVPTDEVDAINTSTRFALLIFSDSVYSEEQLQRLFGVPKLRGMVREGSGPGILDSVLFKKQFPQTDLSRCIIFEAGKTPAGMGTFVLYGAGCLLLLTLTGVVWVVARNMDEAEAAKQLAEERSEKWELLEEESTPKTHVPSAAGEPAMEAEVLEEDAEPRPHRPSKMEREAMRQRVLKWMRTKRFGEYLGELHVTLSMAIFGILLALCVSDRVKQARILKFLGLEGFTTPLLRRQYRKLAEAGEVVMAMTWMANSALLDGTTSVAPALLVMCAEGSAEAEDHTQRIYLKMLRRDQGQSASRDEMLISILLSREQYVRSRVRPLPASFSEGRAVYLVDAELHRDAIVGGDLIEMPFIVCLFHPKVYPCILPIPTEAL